MANPQEVAKIWSGRATYMRRWAAEVKNPYTKIEMMALAEIYIRVAEQSARGSAKTNATPSHAIARPFLMA
jgi:hypothetical protein